MNKPFDKAQGKLTFQERVYALTRKIPRGKVATYGAIALALGVPGAARAVGNALGKNPSVKLTPCRRVVRSNGEVGGYASGTAKKVAWLRKEGVTIKNNKVDLKRFGYVFRKNK